MTGDATADPGARAIAAPARRSPWPGRLRRLNPAHLLFGPVFQRDVRASGRKIGLYVTRGLYTLALLLVSSIALFGVWAELEFETGAARLQALQSTAPGITIALLWFQFILIAMAAPAATAPCLCDERNKRTLPALLTTPLTPAHLIFANLSSRAVNILILTAILAPVLLALRVFGGVQATTVFAALAVTLSTALLGAALGLFASIDARRPAAASTMAHILLAAIFFGPIMLLAFAFGMRGGPPPPWALGAAFVTSSPLTLGILSAELMDPGGGGPPIALGGQAVWKINVAINLALALLVCFVAVLRLRARLTAVATGRTPKAWARLARKTKKKRRKSKRAASAAPDASSDRAAPETDPESHDEQVADRSRDVSDRPVLWRELRQPLFRAGLFRVLLYAIAPLFLAWFGLISDVPTEIRYMLPAGAAVFVFLFIGASAAAQCVTGEREGRTWDEILTTRLRGSQILVPKIVAALRRQWPVLAFAVLYLGLLGLGRGDMHPIGPALFTLIIVADLAFLAVTGAAASLLVKRSSTAGILAVGVPLVLWAAIPMLIGMSTALLPGDLDDTSMNLVFLSNPLTMSIASLEGAIEFRDSPRYADFSVGDWDVSMVGFAGAAAFHAGVYLLLGGLILAFCLRRFNRLAGRAS